MSSQQTFNCAHVDGFDAHQVGKLFQYNGPSAAIVLINTSHLSVRPVGPVQVLACTSSQHSRTHTEINKVIYCHAMCIHQQLCNVHRVTVPLNALEHVQLQFTACTLTMAISTGTLSVVSATSTVIKTDSVITVSQYLWSGSIDSHTLQS